MSICFCSQLDKMSNIFQKEFETVNWFLIKEIYNQSVNVIAFNILDDTCSRYLNEVLIKTLESSSSLRNSCHKSQ